MAELAAPGWARLRGKWEYGLFKYPFRAFIPGAWPGREVKKKGYKRIPIRATYFEFLPPDRMKLHHVTPGGKWDLRLSGDYVGTVLLDGQVVGLLSAVTLTRRNNVTIPRKDRP